MAYFMERNLLKLNGYTKTGLAFLLLGFFAIELILVAQGALFWLHLGSLPYYSHLLVSASLITIVAVVLIFFKHTDEGHVCN